MAGLLRKVFSDKASLNLPVFVTFLTAGFPEPQYTVPLLLALEAGGADILELGVPFSDPSADGEVIQDSHKVALSHGVNYSACLGYVKEARKQGLKAPVVFMGYYNPLVSYGEEAAVRDAQEAGANGFLVVDLPAEEAAKFREICTSSELSYVPLIAPSVSDARIAFLTSIADSFIYVVSKMGTTGASEVVESSLPKLISRIRRLAQNTSESIPLAVGFGVSTAAHFDEVGAVADGVIIGSKLLEILKRHEGSGAIAAAHAFCEQICGGKAGRKRTSAPKTAPMSPRSSIGSQAMKVAKLAINSAPAAQFDPATHRFGEFGGQYVPESMIDCLVELEACHMAAKADPAFLAEFESLYGYMNRPSDLYYASRLTEKLGGAKIWFKREDMNHTGSHKINNAVGQALLALRLGKRRIIAETAGGHHGVATATICAKFGLKCVVYMGAVDVQRQALNVSIMKMLGAKVVTVTSGRQSLKDAISEAMRDWVTNLSTTHFLVGSASGPHPFPTIVRDFQCLIGKEIKEQLRAQIGKLPDAVIACVGGGSNAIGSFYPFLQDEMVRLIGVEAGGSGTSTREHSATLNEGTKGVLHGASTYLLQSADGQILQTHSISSGLNYPAVGPEHAFLKDTKRAEYRVATDVQALKGLKLCVEEEGIIPALETAHAVWTTAEVAQELGKDANIVMCLSGRGDEDVQQISEQLPNFADTLDWHLE